MDEILYYKNTNLASMPSETGVTQINVTQEIPSNPPTCFSSVHILEKPFPCQPHIHCHLTKLVGEKSRIRMKLLLSLLFAIVALFATCQACSTTPLSAAGIYFWSISVETVSWTESIDVFVNFCFVAFILSGQALIGCLFLATNICIYILHRCICLYVFVCIFVFVVPGSIGTGGCPRSCFATCVSISSN